jgi:hypothetical protein
MSGLAYSAKVPDTIKALRFYAKIFITYSKLSEQTKRTTSTTMVRSLPFVLGCAAVASAHSWLGCTDHDNEQILAQMKGNATELHKASGLDTLYAILILATLVHY